MNDAELDQIIEVVQAPDRACATVEDRLLLAEDARQITDLVMLYGWLCDRRRWDDLLAYYTDDFERTLAGTLVEKVSGKEKIRELYLRPVLARASGEGGPPPSERMRSYELRHLIHPPVVRVADDGATARAVAVYSLVASSGDGAEFRRGEHEGAYLFGMRRIPNVGWRFASMTVISENSRNPMFQAAPAS